MNLLCPNCRSGAAPLTAALICPGCERQWPSVSVDGGPEVAVLLDDSDAAPGLATAQRLLDALEHGAALPPPSATDRGHLNALAIYGGAHYGRWTQPPLAHPDEAWIGRALARLPSIPDGPALVLGAATVGETLALPPEREVIALDGSVPMLAFASGLAATDRFVPVQTTPDRYTARRITLPAMTRQRLGAVRLLAADARSPPLPARSVAIVVALNLLDSITDPAALLSATQDLLMPGGALLLAAPFHWNDDVTASPNRLDADVPPAVDHAPAIEARIEAKLPQMRLRWSDRAVPWPLRIHDRLTSSFSLHALLFEKR